MSFLEYDYEDLARQVQTRLDRLGVSFLRAHGARMKLDVVDFHGWERIDLELSHADHTLVVHQVGRPRGFEADPAEPPGPSTEEEFESTFDGWPAGNVPREELARWLARLPPGEAPPEKKTAPADPSNPFATERPRPVPSLASEPSFNPFLSDRRQTNDANPFADPDRERKRQEMLRRLKGDD